MKHIPVFALLLAGLIHWLPFPGLLGSPMLQRLYGVDASNPDIAILLQHRAILFGILGTFLWGAVYWPTWRVHALATGLVSAASFIAVAWWVGDHGQAIQRVVVADVLASVLLAAGLMAELCSRRALRA